jgi:hypothetical protein
MIERGIYDVLDATAASKKVTHFSAADDRLWAGVTALMASETITLESASRYDFYVLKGSLESDDTAPMMQGAFASRCVPGTLRAGEGGATVFVYRERSPQTCETVTQSAADRTWHAARAAGMRVAPLSESGHRLTLVEWEPGARTREHDHPRGEEIFVLSGELRSQDARYPSGTWLRLHPGSRHEPFAEVPTVIMLRNGHLGAADSFDRASLS